MISFSQFLTEARMAPLYHGTRIGSFESILTDGGFKAFTVQSTKEISKEGSKEHKRYVHPYSEGLITGVSLTRNKRLAQSWAGAVVFVFDQEKLIRNYKLKPFNYFQKSMVSARNKGSTPNKDNPSPWGGVKATDMGSEYEEFLLLRSHETLPLKYVDHILIKKEYEDTIVSMMNRTGNIIPYEIFNAS